jgi:hypothetical protein
MKMAWRCSRCHGVWRQRLIVRWYELWFAAMSTSRPFCCTTCGRRAWSAVPEDAELSIAFTAPVGEVHDVNLAALDAIVIEWPPVGSVASVEQLLLDDASPVRPPRPRAAPGVGVDTPPTRRCTNR